MKGIAAPLAALEGNALPLAQEGAEGEESARGEGFDALLALVNAQAPNTAAPVKVLAPSVGVQCAPLATGKDVQPSGAQGAKGIALDVAPTQVFLPWLDASAAHVAVQSEELSAAVDGEVLPDALAVAASELSPSQSAQEPSPVAPNVQVTQTVQPAVREAVSAQSASVELPQRSASEPATKIALKSVPPQRKSTLRGSDERSERMDSAATPAPAVQNVVVSQLVPPAQSAPKAQVSAPSVSDSAGVTADAAKKAPVSVVPAPLLGAEQAPADPDAFAGLLAPEQQAPTAATPVDSPADLSIASSKAQRAKPQQAQPAPTVSEPAVAIPLSDPETQARVTKIEFFSSAEAPAASETLPAETQPVEHKLEPEQADTMLGDAREQSASGEQAPADQRAPSDQAAADANKPNAAPAARFEVTEGKGMRGLDAVVASLLRPYADKPEGAGGVRVPTARVAHVSVETGKSQSVKLEERVSNVGQALDAAALRRQEEERRGELRELAEPAVPHFAQHMEPQADLPAENQPAQASAPVNVPLPPQPDPDAAMMGKIARGESLNAAVSIEHPELGSMDVLVQNENGRIDVRATLDSPRAAAVLRAHESALRYGVQQAGMTFGALRVNARTGEAKVEKSRDVPKRRRNNDWEA